MLTPTVTPAGFDSTRRASHDSPSGLFLSRSCPMCCLAWTGICRWHGGTDCQRGPAPRSTASLEAGCDGTPMARIRVGLSITINFKLYFATATAPAFPPHYTAYQGGWSQLGIRCSRFSCLVLLSLLPASSSLGSLPWLRPFLLPFFLFLFLFFSQSLCVDVEQMH